MLVCRRDSLTFGFALSLVLVATVLALPACEGSRSGPPGRALVATTSASTNGGGVTSANLQLRVSKNACTANVAQDYFQVKNSDSAAVPLSSIAIKYWVNDTTGAALVPNVWYGGCVTSTDGTCLHPVTGVTATATPFSPACGPDASHQANWEITIATTDATPLAPGQSWSNVQTASNLATHANFTPGTATWFSGCGTGGAYLLDTHFAVYAAGDLVTTEGAATPLCRAPQVVQIQTYLDTTYYATSEIASSFLSAAGQQIDCIDFSAQKSVRAWRARGVTIPTSFAGVLPRPASVPPPNTPPGSDLNSGVPDQNGHARQCSTGFVPVIRPTIAEVQAAGGVAAYKQALLRRPRPQAQSCQPKLCQAGGCQDGCEHDCWLNNGAPGNGDPNGSANAVDWEHAAGIQTSGFLPAGANGYFGLHITTPVYAPSIPTTGEHTDSQLWAQTGGCDNWWNSGTDETMNQCRTGPSCTNCTGSTCDQCAVQSLEVVSISDAPGAPKTGIYFTADGYFLSSCWAGRGGGAACRSCPINPETNEPTDCWVQFANAPITPGMIETLSAPIAGQYGVAPAEMEFTVFNGSPMGHPGWFVFSGKDQQPVGFLPQEAFNWPDGSPGAMSRGPATYLQAGGEVFDTWPGNQHTGTSMVSDNDAWSGFGFAAYQRNIYYYDASQNTHDANLSFVLAPHAEGDFEVAGVCGFKSRSWIDAAGEPGSYDIATGNGVPAGGAGWGTYFYFGGGVTAKEISAGCPQGGCQDLHLQMFAIHGTGNTVVMGPSAHRTCVLLQVSGKFKGAGEAARIVADTNGNWTLNVTSGQDQDTSATAGCFDDLAPAGEFSWSQGQPTVVIGKGPGMACFLTSITGHFQGAGEVVNVTVDQADNMWKLGGSSLQAGVAATARCVLASGVGIFGQGQGNPPRTLPGPGPRPGANVGQICGLSRMTGHFEGGGENIVLAPTGTGGSWVFSITSQQNDVASSATCFTP